MPKSQLIARQSAHPTGLLGHVVARVMALDTAAVNRRVLASLDPRPGERILELGCGHGRSLRRIARRIGDGEVVGVDPSAVMCAVAARHGRAAIRAGRARVACGASGAIPTPSGYFDKAFSVHTLYFWPDLDAGCGELKRVLRPGGALWLAFHVRENRAVADHLPASVYTLRSEPEVAEALERAGFGEVSITTLDAGQVRLARAEA